MNRRPSMHWKYSIFWRIALLLVATQLITVLVAMGINMWLAYERSLDLVAQSIRLRLDSVAEELEQRANLREDGTWELPRSLELDLARRFPDPLFLISPEGNVYFQTVPEVTLESLPDSLWASVREGNIGVLLEARNLSVSWAGAPLYDEEGQFQGALVVHPLTGSVQRELSGVWEAHLRALFWAFFLVIGVAVLTGALITYRLVRPLWQIMRHVEAIGAGNYDVRLPVHGQDELARLATSINRMAEQVARSIHSLRATDRLRRELVASIGHDLRTPLAALIGYLEEARFRLDAGEVGAAREALQVAERQGAYLQRLLEDLFELSVLTGPVPPLRMEPVPLGELIEEVRQRHARAFEEQGIRLELHLPPELPVILADGLRLLRVLDNLLSNARRHTPEGGTVRLAVTVGQDTLCLSVSDTGVGIAPEEQEHLFERYYRGRGARTRSMHGTGLGLAISKAIVEAHQGTISVESTPGEGSTFTVCLPLRRWEEAIIES